MRHVALALAVLAAPLVAQQDPQQPTPESRAQRFLQDCDRNWDDRDSESFCEVRDLTMKPSTRLILDAGQNGGAAFYGSDRNEIRIKALIRATGDTKADAQALAKDIRIYTDDDRVHADGPRERRHQNWAVSFEVWVPRQQNIDAEAHNGGLRVHDVDGRLELQTTNGSVALRNVSGDVHAETTNGSVSAALSGSTWKGTGLDLETTNGSVNLEIPKGYNADLETGTVNGGMNIDFPVTVRGSIGRRITTKLGQGGPRIRATTTNGGVRIREVP